MKRFLFLLGLLFFSFWLSSSGGKSQAPWEGEESLSVNLISQEVDNTLRENERQKTLNSRQNINTATEAVNKKQWNTYKETAKKIQDRLRIVDFALQAIPSGYVISQKANDIKRNQQRILQEIRTAPQALKQVLPNQLQFVEELQMVVRFLSGIVLSYGAINQMERAERQILLDYALAEVDKLASASFSTLMIIRDAKEKANLQKGILKFYIQRDRELVEDILRNFKRF